jgi:hypothetical protein
LSSIALWNLLNVKKAVPDKIIVMAVIIIASGELTSNASQVIIVNTIRKASNLAILIV